MYEMPARFRCSTNWSTIASAYQVARRRQNMVRRLKAPRQHDHRTGKWHGDGTLRSCVEGGWRWVLKRLAPIPQTGTLDAAVFGTHD
jgi:hypothetical protein